MGEVERAIVLTLDDGALGIGEAGSVGSVQCCKCTIECCLVGFLIGGKLEERTGIVGVGVETDVVGILRDAVPVVEIEGRCSIGRGSDVEPAIVVGVGRDGPFASVEGLSGFVCGKGFHLARTCAEVTGNHGEHLVVGSGVHVEASAYCATGEVECLVDVTPVERSVILQLVVVVLVTIVAMAFIAAILQVVGRGVALEVDGVEHGVVRVGGQRDGESHVVEAAVELRHGCGECRFLCFHFIIGGVGFTKDGDGSADGTFQVLKVFEGEVRVGNIVRLHHGVALNVGFVAAVLEGGGVVNGSFQRLTSLHNSFGSH